jgi:hypothetical protein
MQPMLFLRRVVVGVTVVALSACGSSFEPGIALTGRWGGKDLVADLTASGGTLDLSCGFGELNAPLVPDINGRVSAVGYTIRVGGVPFPPGSVAPHVTVQISGQVNGDHLTLFVAVLGMAYVLGPPRYDVVRGAAGNVLRCP